MDIDKNNIQMSIVCNVTLYKRNAKNKRLIEKISSKNTVTQIALLGIAKYLCDLFISNDTLMSTYIPKYLAVGSGTTAATPTDTHLTTEILLNDATNRFEVAQKIIDSTTHDNYVTITLKSYIPTTFDGTIKELGLFTSSSGNTCWARTVLQSPYLIKSEGQLVDVIWTISILSTPTIPS